MNGLRWFGSTPVYQGEGVMVPRFTKSLVLAGLAVGVCLLGAGDGQSGPQTKQQKQAAKQANEHAKQERNLKEVEVLRVAHIYMAMANHDYDGHRAKAMAQVMDAIKILD